MSEEKAAKAAPGQGEGAGVERRGFMKWAAAALSAIVAGALGWPLVTSFASRIFRVSPLYYVKVPGFAGVAEGEPLMMNFTDVEVDAYLTQHLTRYVWVTKHSGTEATVFSPICPHLGCGYNWNGDAQEFVCPCHGSKWDIGGRTLGGPTPRGLDTLPYKVEGGELYVEWQQFKAGIANKERI